MAGFCDAMLSDKVSRPRKKGFVRTSFLASLGINTFKRHLEQEEAILCRLDQTSTQGGRVERDKETRNATRVK